MAAMLLETGDGTDSAAAVEEKKKIPRTNTAAVKEEEEVAPETSISYDAPMLSSSAVWNAFACDGVVVPSKIAGVKKEAAMPGKTAPPKATVLRLGQMSTAEFAANVGASLASDVPDSEKVARVLEARNYRGIHLFADPVTGEVYSPDDIMAKVLNPRVLDPEAVARLGPWVPSTGLGNNNAGGVGDDDEDDEEDEEDD